jgi:hypothetical protein
VTQLASLKDHLVSGIARSLEPVSRSGDSQSKVDLGDVYLTLGNSAT